MKEDAVVWLRKAAENLRDFYKTSDPEATALEEVATEIEHLRAANAELRELVRYVRDNRKIAGTPALGHPLTCPACSRGSCNCGADDWLERADKALEGSK
jgi:hypothetical protein